MNHSLDSGKGLWVRVCGFEFCKKKLPQYSKIMFNITGGRKVDTLKKTVMLCQFDLILGSSSEG